MSAIKFHERWQIYMRSLRDVENNKIRNHRICLPRRLVFICCSTWTTIDLHTSCPLQLWAAFLSLPSVFVPPALTSIFRDSLGCLLTVSLCLVNVKFCKPTFYIMCPRNFSWFKLSSYTFFFCVEIVPPLTAVKDDWYYTAIQDPYLCFCYIT